MDHLSCLLPSSFVTNLPATYPRHRHPPRQASMARKCPRGLAQCHGERVGQWYATRQTRHDLVADLHRQILSTCRRPSTDKWACKDQHYPEVAQCHWIRAPQWCATRRSYASSFLNSGAKDFEVHATDLRPCLRCWQVHQCFSMVSNATANGHLNGAPLDQCTWSRH